MTELIELEEPQYPPRATAEITIKVGTYERSMLIAYSPVTVHAATDLIREELRELYEKYSWDNPEDV